MSSQAEYDRELAEKMAEGREKAQRERKEQERVWRNIFRVLKGNNGPRYGGIPNPDDNF